jgi:4-hydroxy-2-oxoheptanedioate aldolase
MRKSKVLEKLRSGKVAKICSLGHFMPFFVRYAAHFEYDGILLDLEQRAMNDREVQSSLSFCHLYDIDCMVRPSTREWNRLYRYLKDGATGFLIPFIDDSHAAHYIMDAVKFPPLGNRGLDGAGLDADFGLESWRKDSRYTLDANNETFIIAQIETPPAVLEADEIAAVGGIDGVFVGSGDVGLRLSFGSDSTSMTLERAIEQVARAARRCGKAWGAASGSLDTLVRYRKMGAQITIWGGDFSLCEVLENCSSHLKLNLPD